MRIESVACETPSLCVGNEELLRHIELQSRDVPVAKVRQYQRMVSVLLTKVGAQTRYVLDREAGERPFELIRCAMEGALARARCVPADVDLLIYCGVGKGFKEPASAYFYAKAMGMRCDCFDVADACMSWVRSVDIAQQFLMNGRYRRVLVVNGEFNVFGHGYPELFRVRDLEQLAYTFPTYTIGEAATATVLSGEGEPWRFAYLSSPEMCDLCTIALEDFAGYVEASERHNRNGTYKFVSYGAEMFAHAEEQLVKLITREVADLYGPRLYVPHAATSQTYIDVARHAGFDAERVFTKVFPRYGNVVSASVPLGLKMAADEGTLQRGDRVVLIPASAGMSHAVVQMVY